MIIFYPIYFYLVPESVLFQQQGSQQMNESEPLKQLPIKSQQIEMASGEQTPSNWQMFQKHFTEQLKVAIRNKKNWTREEDYLLEKLKIQGSSWEQISRHIQDVDPEKCKRRYTRIKSMKKRWPKQIDNKLKQLYQKQGQSWSVIASQINNCFHRRNINLNPKQVKERYLFYLKQGITQEKWSIQQDLKLIRFLQKFGRQWKMITSYFSNRTQLQLKNRYYGTLKFAQERAKRKLKENKLKQSQTRAQNSQ